MTACFGTLDSIAVYNMFGLQCLSNYKNNTIVSVEDIICIFVTANSL